MSNWKKVVRENRWEFLALFGLVSMFIWFDYLNKVSPPVQKEVSPQAWSLYNGGPSR